MRIRIIAAGALTLVAAAAGLQAPAQAVAAPEVFSLDSRHGPTAGGTLVTVEGSGFTGVTKVTFGTVAGSELTVLSSSKLTVRTPRRIAGTVHAVVYASGGKSAATADDQFRFWNKPVIASVDPKFLGPNGGAVTIRATEFAGGLNLVTWNGTPVPHTVVDGKTYKVTMPAQAPLTVGLRIQSYGGTSDPVQVEYVAPTIITSVSPQSGPAGTVVTIKGKNMYGPLSVWFGDTQWTPTPGQPVFTTLYPPGADFEEKFAAPPHAPGTVDVTIRSLGGTSPTSAATKFTYTP